MLYMAHMIIIGEPFDPVAPPLGRDIQHELIEPSPRYILCNSGDVMCNTYE